MMEEMEELQLETCICADNYNNKHGLRFNPSKAK